MLLLIMYLICLLFANDIIILLVLCELFLRGNYLHMQTNFWYIWQNVATKTILASGVWQLYLMFTFSSTSSL